MVSDRTASDSRGRTPDWEQSFQVERRSLVLPRRKVVFVPVPKSGTTSVRWALAGLAGLSEESMLASTRPVVSPELAAHDLSRWPGRNRWDRTPQEQRDAIVRDDRWLRFALVRNPWTRLWSAWQSKALLQEPLFADWFDADSWWPRIPQVSEQVVEDFRSFVHSLSDPAGRPVDPHWQPQSTILAQAPWLTFIGRTEAMGEVMGRLATHVHADVSDLRFRRENKTPLPYDPALYDPPDPHHCPHPLRSGPGTVRLSRGPRARRPRRVAGSPPGGDARHRRDRLSPPTDRQARARCTTGPGPPT